MLTNKQLITAFQTQIEDDAAAAGINGFSVTTEINTSLPFVAILGRVVTSKGASLNLNKSIYESTQSIEITLRSNLKLSNENLIDIITKSAVSLAKSPDYEDVVASGIDETLVDGTAGVVEKTLTLDFEGIVDISSV